MCLRMGQNTAFFVLSICLVAIGLCSIPASASSAPFIKTISPNWGSTNGGTVITISGSDFESGAEVTVGGVPLTNLTVKSGSIQGTTPAHVAGGADLVVTNPGGLHAAVKALLHNQSFESGTTQWLFVGSGSATVATNASNAHAGASYVELDSSPGERPQLFAANNSETQYYPVKPGDVVTFGGWAYRVAGNGLARWSIEITDANHHDPIYIGSSPDNVINQQWDLQQSQFTVPSGKAFVRIYCEIHANTVASAARFDDAILNIVPGSTGYTYVSPPILTAVSPNWGSPAGGTTRTVLGSGFAAGDKVMFGETQATSVVVNSANAITFFVPPNAAGAVAVKVTGPDGESSTLDDAYTYRTPPPPPSGMNKIRHIIYQLQENRTFDDYFGVMNQYRANHGVPDNAVNGLDLNLALPDLSGKMIKPFHMPTVCVENTQPSWNAAHLDYDNGLMDGFMKTGNYFGTSSNIDPNGTRAIGYYNWNDVPFYYALAFNFAVSDHSFASIMGPTGPNRAYSFAATSLGWVSSPKGPEGGFPNLTIFDLLDQAGISWKYYYQNSSPSWLPVWSVYYKNRGKVLPLHPNYFNDVQDESTFPEVVFIEENGDRDEHPKPDPGTTGGTENIQNGPSDVANIVDALLTSPSWASSAYILTWDEGGGLHDHVVPPSLPAPDGYPPAINPTHDQAGSFTQAGFRVPLIVVSPWTAAHQVSHIVRDHTAILKFIETRFQLPPLTARDAAADNMAEFFDFSSPPRLTPPSLPSQPLNGKCDLNAEASPESGDGQ
jgi:phospholipase C